VDVGRKMKGENMKDGKQTEKVPDLGKLEAAEQYARDLYELLLQVDGWIDDGFVDPEARKAELIMSGRELGITGPKLEECAE